MPMITAFYAGLLGILALVLAGFVVTNRRRAGVGLGSASDSGLERAIRVHGNFVEYVPLILILMALSEVAGMAEWLLHAGGALLVAARIGHASGLAAKSGYSPGRFFGTLVTWIVLLVMALAAVWLGGSTIFGA